jgi:pilus assembly protein CpaE
MLGVSVVPGSSGAAESSIALIGPDEERRRGVAAALAESRGASVCEYPAYPADFEELLKLQRLNYDVVIIDLDSDPDLAFDLVESLCADGSTPVMVYSAQTSLDLALRFMRAGAREFLSLPLNPSDMTAALARLSARRSSPSLAGKASRKLFVFLGTKGGCGVTTIAANFAIAIAQESGQSTLLIDFGLPLGDAAINLGMITEYSTANALQDSGRLDASFLSTLLIKHSSGLSVLPAPGEFSPIQASHDAINRLLTVARKSFDYVVVDAGSRVDLMDTALFEDSASVYLITQVGVSELRNSNRMISQFFSSRSNNLQIVLNRYTPHALLVDDTQITKALTRPAQWKIPDDYATARRTRNSATPIAMEDSPISNVIRQMARAACGQSAKREKKKGFSFFGKKKNTWSPDKPLLKADEDSEE